MGASPVYRRGDAVVTPVLLAGSLRLLVAIAMEPTPAEDARLWSEMAPQLDEALNQLSDEDREAVLLRFFAQNRMREVGQALGVSEDARPDR